MKKDESDQKIFISDKVNSISEMGMGIAFAHPTQYASLYLHCTLFLMDFFFPN